MILVPGKFIYLAAPRTGSRTTCDALVRYHEGKKLSKGHHATRAELEGMADNPELAFQDVLLPVYSVIRDPYHIIMGAFGRAPDVQWEHFLATWNPDSLGEWGGRMTPYEGYVDHYFIFEDGLEAMFKRLGLPDTPLGHLGRYETHFYKPISPAGWDVMREKFAEDFARYDHWKQINANFSGPCAAVVE